MDSFPARPAPAGHFSRFLTTGINRESKSGRSHVSTVLLRSSRQVRTSVFFTTTVCTSTGAGVLAELEAVARAEAVDEAEAGEEGVEDSDFFDSFSGGVGPS